MPRIKQINQFKTLCQEYVFENCNLQVISQPHWPNHFILEDSTANTVIRTFKVISEVSTLYPFRFLMDFT